MDIIEPESDGAAPKPREALFAHAHVLANLLRPAEPGRPELPPEHAALLRRMARDLDRFRRGDPPAPREEVPPRADTPSADATDDPRIAALTRRIEALERGMAGEATVAADALAPLRTLLEVLSVEVTRLRQGAGAVPPEAATPPQVTAAPAPPAPTPPASEAPASEALPPVRRASAGTVALRLAATLGAVTLLAGGLLAVWQPHFIPSRPNPMRPLPPPPVRPAVTHSPAAHPPATHPPTTHPVAAVPASKPHPPAHPLPSATVATPVHPASPPAAPRSVAPPPKPEATPHEAAAVPKASAPTASPPASATAAPPPAAPRSVAPPLKPEAPPGEAAAVPKASAPTASPPASATAATPRTAAPPPQAPAAAPNASSPEAPHAASPAPAVIVPAPSPQRAAAPAGKPVPPVAIRAIADTWVSLLDAQGHTVLARLLHAGDTLVPPAPGLTLTTGNAGGTELVVNGHAGPPLGATGVVLHAVKLTPPPG
jgi:hypothetical protein